MAVAGTVGGSGVWCAGGASWLMDVPSPGSMPNWMSRWAGASGGPVLLQDSTEACLEAQEEAF